VQSIGLGAPAAPWSDTTLKRRIQLAVLRAIVRGACAKLRADRRQLVRRLPPGQALYGLRVTRSGTKRAVTFQKRRSSGSISDRPARPSTPPLKNSPLLLLLQSHCPLQRAYLFFDNKDSASLNSDGVVYGLSGSDSASFRARASSACALSIACRR